MKKQVSFIFIGILFFLIIQSIMADDISDENEIIIKTENYIKTKIEDPVISRVECPIPGLFYFSAYGREYINEDPVITTSFFTRSNGEISNYLLLEWIEYTPKTEDEAMLIASWILQAIYEDQVIIKNIVYEKTNNASAFKVNIIADYYEIHTYFDEEPLYDVVFIISCTNGNWNIENPDFLQ